MTSFLAESQFLDENVKKLMKIDQFLMNFDEFWSILIENEFLMKIDVFWRNLKDF